MVRQPLVSVIIPTHNRKKMLERLLVSIFKNSYKNIEVIIVDDASNDGTSEYIKIKFENRKIIFLRNNTNHHVAFSKNLGSNKAKGELLLFIDDDNILDKKMIFNLVETLISDPNIGEVGPIMYYLNNKKKFFWTGTKRNMFTTKTFGLKHIPKSKIWNTDDFPNIYMVKSSIVKNNKINFRSDLGAMYDEADYSYKIKKIGFALKVVKSAVSYHDYFIPEGSSTAFFYHTMTDKWRVYFTARNRIIFHADYGTKLQLIGILLFWNWIFAGFYLYIIIAYSGPGNFSISNKIYLCFFYIKGVLDGYKYAFKKR